MSENINGSGAQPPPTETPEVLKHFTQNCIGKFFTCVMCYAERPRGVNIASYARFHVGFTDKGLQVWCSRHNINVLHLDFEGKVVKGSSTVFEEDRQAALARAPVAEAVIEKNGLTILTAGAAVLRERLSVVGERDESNPKGTTTSELLRSFSAELDNYLASGELTSEWAMALKMIRVARGEGIIT